MLCIVIKLNSFFPHYRIQSKLELSRKTWPLKKIQKWIQMKWVPANYSAYFLTKPRHTFRAFGVLRFNSGDSSNAIFNSKFLIFFSPFGMKKISSFYWMSKERKRLRGAFITFHSCQDSTEFIQEFFNPFLNMVNIRLKIILMAIINHMVFSRSISPFFPFHVFHNLLTPKP